MSDTDYPPAPGPWIRDAACHGMTAAFHIGDARSSSNAYQRKLGAAALALCDRCPVLADCRAWACGPDEPAIDLIAGGMTPRERARLRKGRAA